MPELGSTVGWGDAVMDEASRANHERGRIRDGNA
jgi:hypothetical protein